MGEASSFSTACSAAWGVLTGWRTRGRTLLPSPHPHRWSLPGAVGASTSLSPNVMCHNVLTFHGAPLAHLHDTPHCTDGETEAGWVTADGFLLLLPAHLPRSVCQQHSHILQGRNSQAKAQFVHQLESQAIFKPMDLGSSKSLSLKLTQLCPILSKGDPMPAYGANTPFTHR